jgi:pilus assembly protein CpaB
MNITRSFITTFESIRKHKIAALFATALVTGVVAAWGIKSHITDFLAAERERLVPKIKTVEVVVAKRPMKAGEIVSAETMAVRPVPMDFVPSSAIRPDRFEGYVGAKLSQGMQAGEALVSTALAGADIATFSSKVKTGIRAMTVSVDEVNSVSGMLQPGDRIDLLLSVKPPLGASALVGASAGASAGATGAEITAPLLQDILVLATGRQVRPAQADEALSRNFNAITVEVSPDQAQKLVVAQRGGKLTAMLRNPGDHQMLSKQSLDIYALLGLKPPAPVVPVPMASAPVPSITPAASITFAVPLAAPLQTTEIIVGGRGPLVARGAASAPSSSHVPVLSDLAQSTTDTR